MSENLIEFGIILLTFVIVVGIIIISMFLYKTYIDFIIKLNAKKITKKLESGKINDKKLVRLYQSSKKQKDNTFLAVFTAGLFYKQYLRIFQTIYGLYEQEMIKRNLSL